jgi:hypothetical protein
MSQLSHDVGYQAHDMAEEAALAKQKYAVFLESAIRRDIAERGLPRVLAEMLADPAAYRLRCR